jgi:FtsH-binding integral membrane protein
MTAIIEMILSFLGPIASKYFDNQAKRDAFMAETRSALMANQTAMLDAQKGIITAEATGGWLQRNWRPILMLWFSGLIGAYWFGFTAPNLPAEAITGLLDIVYIGIGGYVVGRSVEKVAASVVPAIVSQKVSNPTPLRKRTPYNE